MEETIKGWSMQNKVKFTISQCQSLDTYLCDWVVFLLSSSCEDFLVFPLSPSPFLVLLTTIKCQHYQQQLPIDAEPGDCVINCMQDFTCNSSLRRWSVHSTKCLFQRWWIYFIGYWCFDISFWTLLLPVTAYLAHLCSD